jgi:hypothetical protein
MKLFRLVVMYIFLRSLTTVAHHRPRFLVMYCNMDCYNKMRALWEETPSSVAGTVCTTEHLFAAFYKPMRMYYLIFYVSCFCMYCIVVFFLQLMRNL